MAAERLPLLRGYSIRLPVGSAKSPDADRGGEACGEVPHSAGTDRFGPLGGGTLLTGDGIARMGDLQSADDTTHRRGVAMGRGLG